jgi:hypothetical protein
MFDWSIETSLNLFDGNLWFLADNIAKALRFDNLARSQCDKMDRILPENTGVLYEFFRRNAGLKYVQLGISGLAELPMDLDE